MLMYAVGGNGGCDNGGDGVGDDGDDDGDGDGDNGGGDGDGDGDGDNGGDSDGDDNDDGVGDLFLHSSHVGEYVLWGDLVVVTSLRRNEDKMRMKQG